MHGREGIKQYVAASRSAYLDACFIVEDQVAERDIVAIRWAARGTHRGEFAGIPPTGSRVTATGIEFDRIVGGKIDEAWISYHLFADGVLDPERVKRAVAAMHYAFPDLHVAQAGSITEGDKIAFRWAMSGTHEGEFMGIAPTGKLVMAMGIDIVRVVDDEILDYWGEFDVMGLLRQLGVTP